MGRPAYQRPLERDREEILKAKRHMGYCDPPQAHSELWQHRDGQLNERKWQKRFDRDR